MRMAPDKSPIINEDEIKRRQMLLKRRLNEERINSRDQFYNKLATELRRFLLLALSAICVWLFVLHRARIEKKISQVIAKIQADSKNSPLRQGALKHENDIDQIAK